MPRTRRIKTFFLIRNKHVVTFCGLVLLGTVFMFSVSSSSWFVSLCSVCVPLCSSVLFYVPLCSSVLFYVPLCSSLSFTSFSTFPQSAFAPRSSPAHSHLFLLSLVTAAATFPISPRYPSVSHSQSNKVGISFCSI